MKNTSILVLQSVVILTGLAALAILIRFPLAEGRAENLDLFSIYFDPFILYGYASSVIFFVLLYKTFRLLGFIRKNKAFSADSVNELKSIRFYAVLQSVLIVLAGLYIRIFHNVEDDPAGFLALTIVATFIFATIAISADVFERIFQNGVDIKSENERLTELSKK